MQPADRPGFVPSQQEPVDEQAARLGALEPNELPEIL
jgi:hypothetical protein